MTLKAGNRLEGRMGHWGRKAGAQSVWEQEHRERRGRSHWPATQLGMRSSRDWVWRRESEDLKTWFPYQWQMAAEMKGCRAEGDCRRRSVGSRGRSHRSPQWKGRPQKVLCCRSWLMESGESEGLKVTYLFPLCFALLGKKNALILMSVR